MKVTSSPSISLFAANRLRGRTSICGLLFGKAIFHVRASSSLGRFVLAMTTPACSVRSLEDGDSGDKSSQNCKKLKARCLGRYVQLHNAGSGFNGGIRSVFRRQIGADDWYGGVWCGLEFFGDGCCGRRSPLRCCHGSP
ncbi:Hypp7133 [Branchiostoma lanceolatum]|nr:Hypp7133 [Branchiostoma lanceolatum]